MLYKKQGKTKHWVVIPLRDEANTIFINSFNRNIPETNLILRVQIAILKKWVVLAGFQFSLLNIPT